MTLTFDLNKNVLRLEVNMLIHYLYVGKSSDLLNIYKTEKRFPLFCLLVAHEEQCPHVMIQTNYWFTHWTDQQRPLEFSFSLCKWYR